MHHIYFRIPVYRLYSKTGMNNNEDMKNKNDIDRGLAPLQELLPYTMSYMETLWNYPIERRDECINLEEERMARLLKKKLQDDYNQE